MVFIVAIRTFVSTTEVFRGMSFKVTFMLKGFCTTGIDAMMSSMSAMHCRMRLQLTREGEGRTTSAVEARFFVLVRVTYKTSWVIERFIAFSTVEDTMSFSMVGGQLM